MLHKAVERATVRDETVAAPLQHIGKKANIINIPSMISTMAPSSLSLSRL